MFQLRSCLLESIPPCLGRRWGQSDMPHKSSNGYGQRWKWWRCRSQQSKMQHMIDVRRSWKCSRWQTLGLLKSKSKAFGLGCHPTWTDDQEVYFQHTWCKCTWNRCQWVHLSKKLTQANLQKLQYVLWLLTPRGSMRWRCLKHSTCLTTEWWLP